MLTNQQVTLLDRAATYSTPLRRVVKAALSAESFSAPWRGDRTHRCNTLECNLSTLRAANWMKHPSLLYGLYPLSLRSAIPDLYAFSISQLCSPRFFIVLPYLNFYSSLSVCFCLSSSCSFLLLWSAYIRPPLPFYHSNCNMARLLPIKPSGHKFN